VEDQTSAVMRHDVMEGEVVAKRGRTICLHSSFEYQLISGHPLARVDTGNRTTVIG
jgi:hypothetical protein